MYKALISVLEEFVPSQDIKEMEPMSRHTTLQVGGPARVFVEISSTEQLHRIMDYLPQVEMPYCIVGNGSNLLVSDRGFEGVVLHLGSQFAKICVAGTKVTASAGAWLRKVRIGVCGGDSRQYRWCSGDECRCL